MGSVSNILSSMFPNYTQDASGTSANTGNNSTTNYGDAVEIAISQQNTGSGNIDTVSLYGYGQNSGHQVLSATATATSAESAFEQLINNLGSFGDSAQTSGATNILQNMFNQADTNLTQDYGTGNGSTDISQGMESDGVPYFSMTIGGSNHNGANSQSPPSIAQILASYHPSMMQTTPFVNSVINALQA